MHPPTWPPLRRSIALVAVLVALIAGSACTDDSGPGPSTTGADQSTSTSVGTDPALEAMLITASDLPPGYAAEPDNDGAETVTTFCVGEDAAAGLQASGRALIRMRRDPTGVALLQLIFRFEGDGAGTFVQQADDIFDRCHEVPDAQGLAFSYGPVSAGIDQALAGLDGLATRFGSSVGSGSFSENIAVFRQGDVAQLIAVLAVDTPRTDLDALTESVVRAALARFR